MILDTRAVLSAAAARPSNKTVASDKKKGARQPEFRMSGAHRVKIKNSNILNALIEHVDGKREMSATQVTAGLGLLKKVLPDLQSIEHSGDPENPVQIITRVELVAGDGDRKD